jgi:hypothetical protein
MDREPFRHPLWMKVVAIICLIGALAMVLAGLR